MMQQTCAWLQAAAAVCNFAPASPCHALAGTNTLHLALLYCLHCFSLTTAAAAATAAAPDFAEILQSDPNRLKTVRELL
jgi:hypothetical protein